MQIHQYLWMSFHLWETTPLPFDLHHESPLSLALRVAVLQDPIFVCLKPEHEALPRAMHWILLLRTVKHLRWDLRYLPLQPDTYQDFSRKCWRCRHTHPTSQGPGLPGNMFPYLTSPSRFWHLHCSFWNTARGWWAREGGSHLRWLFNLLNHWMKIGRNTE